MAEVPEFVRARLIICAAATREPAAPLKTMTFCSFPSAIFRRNEAQFSQSGSMLMTVHADVAATAHVYQPKLAPTSTNRPGSSRMMRKAKLRLVGS